MNQEKRDKLSKQGWTVGSVAEFLQLTPAEATHELRANPLRLLLGCRKISIREKSTISPCGIDRFLLGN